jgi:hypothetical protein
MGAQLVRDRKGMERRNHGALEEPVKFSAAGIESGRVWWALVRLDKQIWVMDTLHNRVRSLDVSMRPKQDLQRILNKQAVGFAFWKDYSGCSLKKGLGVRETRK